MIRIAAITKYGMVYLPAAVRGIYLLAKQIAIVHYYQLLLARSRRLPEERRKGTLIDCGRVADLNMSHVLPLTFKQPPRILHGGTAKEAELHVVCRGGNVSY